ncbi:MAG TPA: amidase [Kribbellaceae bacterium]|nr:amidase [Kribbellaceae bacterium]
MTELHDLTALDQAAAIRSGDLKPTELAEAYLDRIAAHDSAIGAYLTVTADLARRQAAAAEEAVRAGTELSPLHGVPIAIKDVTRVAGVHCTFGSVAFAEHVPDADDDVVGRLKDAGTVILGKTNTPEFALTCYTENKLAPPTRNPWDPERSPSGSSGGSAAAVAAGLAPIAHGTDHGGSIRTPASACGLVGLKPSRGRVSTGPDGDFSGMSTHGPIARTVADAAALLDVMTGELPGETRNAPALAPGETFLGHARRVPGWLRVGAVLTPLLPGVEIHADCVTSYQRTATLLAGLGHEVEEAALPADDGLADAFIQVMSTLAGLPTVDDEDLLMPFTRTLRAIATQVSGVQLAAALGVYERSTQRITADLFSRYDVLLSPALAQPPVAIGALRDDSDQDAEFGAQAAFMPFSPLYNVTGGPSISLPLHWTDEGLPIGIMLGARYGDEATLLALSAQLEAAQPWHDRRPAVW